jgi:hypothetical protein
MKKNKEIETSRMIRTEDLVDITDKMELFSYYHQDPETKEESIQLRAKFGEEFDIGVDVGPFLSEKIIQSMRRNKILE